MPTLADRAGLMRLAERRRVQAAMDQFSARFPELFFVVYTGVFRQTESLRIFGFWLLNRAVFEDVPDVKNDAGIVLVIDVERKSASISFGYQLDAYLDEDDTFQCLSKAHPPWLEGHYDLGIVALLRMLEKILQRKCQQAQRDPQKFAQKVMPPQWESLVKRIRSSPRKGQEPCGDPQEKEEEGSA
jgi:uncharacterized membrane protein YgcG